jgi:hypothetical protein
MRWWLVALLCAGAAQAAQPDYFPLQVGNRWVLQTSAAAPEVRTIDVVRSRTVAGKTYFLVSGYAVADVWMREAADGTLYALDSSGSETVLARLATGTPSYGTSLSGCAQTAQTSAAASRGPNFDFSDALAVAYQPEGCRDVGIVQESYAAGVGLVHRSITTLRGEVIYDLVYARVNGAAVIGRSKEIVVADDFSRGSNGWLAGFTDYSLQTGDLRFVAELRPLPDEVDAARSGFYVQSMNRSDDVFMFLKKALGTEDGLAPDQAYRVSLDIRFASNAPSGCVGIGGAPGESVYVKAGAAIDEPVASVDGGGYVRLAADKGQQASGGKDAAVIGNVANGTPCEGSMHPYATVARQASFTVQTDHRGSLWLLVGTDSGFEGLTGLYYQSLTARIVPVIGPVARAVRRRK